MCAGSCGPGNLHLINGLGTTPTGAGCRCWRSRRISRRSRSACSTSRKRIRQELFREASVYCELVSIPEQVPHVMESAMRAALERVRGRRRRRPGRGVLRRRAAGPDPGAQGGLGDPAGRGPARGRGWGAERRGPGDGILAGAGCAGAHDQLMEFAGTLQAPVVHAMRGKEFVEYDNRFDVGMTGLIGFGSGYRAMEHCDALVMLGTDFPYRQFFPEGVPVIQVDVRGENIGRRVPVTIPLVGTVKDTIEALLPLLEAKSDSKHLDRMDRPLPAGPVPAGQARRRAAGQLADPSAVRGGHDQPARRGRRGLHGRLQDLISNHSPKFLPPLQPCLRTGTEALTTAALAWLARK